MIIRERHKNEYGWGCSQDFFIASKRVNGKVKGTYNTEIRINLFTECCKFQYIHVDGKVTKINIYYDEAKIINDFKLAFYEQGKRGRIEENELFIDEIVLDMNELVGENMCGPYYKRNSIWSLYERHYKHVLGEWVFNRVTLTNKLHAIVNNFSDRNSYIKLAELQMKIEALGNKPENHNRLPKGIITFLHIDQYIDVPNCTTIDFRSNNDKP